jgi:SynChlorMet cassette protein ScmD
MHAKQDYPIANPDVVLREEFDDWAVLYNPDNAYAVGIDPVGVVIWKRLDGKHTLDQLVHNLDQHFCDVPSSALEEVTSFVTSLVESGFVGYELEMDS